MWEKQRIFRSARTSCRTFDVPSTRPVHPSRNNFSWVHRWAVTLPPGLRYPSNCIFYESWWCQLSNSDENTNTKTNTDTNTNTETNKGKTNDSYDVIYFWKGDDKRILNVIYGRLGLRKLDQILGLNRSARLNGDIGLRTPWHFDLWHEERRRKRRKIFGEGKYL